jgi:hypothetical protein
MTADPQKLAKWKKQIDKIQQQILHLHHQRAMWREMSDAVATSSEHDDRSFFLDHYTSMYVDGAAMAVRRLAVDTGQRQEISLGILVADIAANPCAITRNDFLARYEDNDDDRDWAREDWLRIGQETWDRDWGDPQTGCLNVAAIQADLELLRSTAEKVKGFTDRTVAHIDSRGAKNLPTFNDLDLAIDTLGRLFKKYAALITGSGWAHLEPTMQGDWKRPFREPLFEPH